MSTNSLLISMAGVPKILSDFIPDNGLAILASCLKENNHNSKILDFNTTDTLEKVFEGKALREIKNIAEKVFIEKKKVSLFDVIKLRKLSWLLEKQSQKVFDDITDDVCRMVKENRIDWVGIKLWAGDGFRYSLFLAEKLKRKCPGIKVFGGGPQVDIFQDEIFKITDHFDALCFGEGEETIVALADFVAGKKNIDNIPNIIFKNNGKIIKTQRKFIENLNGLPLPEYGSDVYSGIGNKIKMFVIDESRGCKNYCAFCIHPVKSGRMRKKNPLRIVEEFEKSISNHGVHLFRYAGSSTPADLLEESAKCIREKNLKVAYTCFGHFEEMKDVNFQLVRGSGCASIFFGLESASPEILTRAMHKKTSLPVAESVIKKCKEA
ncbi:MAG: B12-binding domain-containing radical SAM protein, partial [Candidatus Ratteibacteria bacterium]